MGIATSYVQNGTSFHPPHSLTALTKTYSSPIFFSFPSPSTKLLQSETKALSLFFSFSHHPTIFISCTNVLAFLSKCTPNLFSPLCLHGSHLLSRTPLSQASVSSLCSLLPLLPPHRVFSTPKPEKGSSPYLNLSNLYTTDKPLHDLAPACI